MQTQVRDESDVPGIVPNIETDFERASIPKNDFARDLKTQVETLQAAGNGANLRVASGDNKSTTYWVNPFLLNIKPGWNCRDHEAPHNIEHVIALAHQIKEGGVKKALFVNKEGGRLYITDGHCRYLAVMYAINELGAQIVSVPITEEDRFSSEADRLAGQILRNGGKKLEPLEQGRVLFRLRKLGWTIEQMKASFFLSRSRIIQLLELNSESTPEIKELISTGRVAATFAQEVIKKTGSPAAAAPVLHQAVKVAGSRGRTKASGKDLPPELRQPAKTNASKPVNLAVDHRASAPEPIVANDSCSPGTIAELVLAQAQIHDEGDTVTMRLPADLFHRMMSALKAAYSSGLAAA